MKAKFIKHKDPRRVLGLDRLSRRSFQTFKDFIDWVYLYVVPDFYHMPHGTKLYDLIKRKVVKEGTDIPWDLYYHICDNILREVTITQEDSMYLTCSRFPTPLRTRFPFSDDNSILQEELHKKS